MIKIVVAGSMDIPTAAMRQAIQGYIERLVVYAAVRPDSFTFYMGDNPAGVDALMLAACIHHRVSYKVWGVGKPRVEVGADNFINAKAAERLTGALRWTARDQAMITASDSGRFLSNGKLIRTNNTPTGTQAGYSYMLSLNKPAILLDFSKPLP